MPTGGVAPTEENLTGRFKAGVHCVGMGSQLITKDIIAEEKYDILAKRSADALAIIAKLNK